MTQPQPSDEIASLAVYKRRLSDLLAIVIDVRQGLNRWPALEAAFAQMLQREQLPAEFVIDDSQTIRSPGVLTNLYGMLLDDLEVIDATAREVLGFGPFPDDWPRTPAAVCRN